jgi:hypothetical protein
MKYWTVFLLFFISFSEIHACGAWYPDGEDTRFSLLYPGWFDNGGLSEFYYSARNIAEEYVFSAENDNNTSDWWDLVGQSVDKELVFQTIYVLSSKEVMEFKDHPMIKVLREMKDESYINYLVFAKTYSHLNGNYDSWERNQSHLDSLRNNAAEIALGYAENCEDEWLKRRYAFLALRFYYYNNNESEVVALYNKYFKDKSQWAIDRWAEYHYLWYEKDPAQRGVRVAQLFATIDSKRHGLWRLFPKSLPKEQLLQCAKNNEEKANVHAISLSQEKGKVLNELQAIYALDPTNTLLKFLIIREVNKLENWVLGPEITAYAPVIHPKGNLWDIEVQIIKSRIKEDRKYALKLLKWLLNEATELDNDMRIACIATLALVTNQDEIGFKELNQHKFTGKELEAWRDYMLILFKTRMMEHPELAHETIEGLLFSDYKLKNTMLFTLGRTFEFKNNLKYAILLYSNLNEKDNDQNFTWRESNGTTTYNIDFYFSGFDYFDANYTAQQVEKSWKAIDSMIIQNKNDLLLKRLEDNKWKWHDLIGTKYLRENMLIQSIVTWREIPNEYWYSDAWNYDIYLQANPFYADFYSSHAKTKGDTISYTKLEIAEELQKRIRNSEKLQGNMKAKVLFDIGSCYFNMTQYGNSWMMKRYYWTRNVHNTIFIDNDDFNQCILAKKYYLAAKEAAVSDEFKALCLRMAGRCESYSIRFKTHWNKYDTKKYNSFDDFVFHTNKYYNQLKNEYPENKDELLTNCLSFDRYYFSILNN